jgi:hypothetical protein
LTDPGASPGRDVVSNDARGRVAQASVRRAVTRKQSLARRERRNDPVDLPMV